MNQNNRQQMAVPIVDLSRKSESPRVFMHDDIDTLNGVQVNWQNPKQELEVHIHGGIKPRQAIALELAKALLSSSREISGPRAQFDGLSDGAAVGRMMLDIADTILAKPVE